MKSAKRRYRIETYGYGVFFRWATSARAALSRVVQTVFGRGYDGWEHEYWNVTAV